MHLEALSRLGASSRLPQERSLLSIVTFLEDLDQKPALHDTEPNGLSSTNPRATVASVASRFWTNPDVLKEQLESEMEPWHGTQGGTQNRSVSNKCVATFVASCY